MWGATCLTLPTLALLALAGRIVGQELKPRAVLKGHAEPVACLAFSPDGKALASGGRGYDAKTRTRWGELRLWDVAAGKEVTTLKEHQDGLVSLAFSPDGKSIASSSSDGQVRLWDVAKRETRAALPGLDRGFGCIVAFSPDGKRLGLAGETVAKVYELPGGKEVASITRRVRGWGATFSPDLATLASPDYQDMDLWDVATGKERLTLSEHRGEALAPAFTSDGKTVAVPSRRRIDAETWAGEIKLWDVSTGRERATITGRAEFLSGIALSPDGKRLALVTAKQPGDAAELKLIDVPTGRLLGSLQFKASQGAPWRLLYSPDGKVLAGAGFRDGSVGLWDVR
jgi:WD40 repeat protein